MQIDFHKPSIPWCKITSRAARIRKRAAAGFLLCMFANMTQAATYTIATPNYTQFQDFTACTTTRCANFDATMRISGSFTTATPLTNLGANNVPDIKALVTQYSFSDGQTTYSSTDPLVRLAGMPVGTDANGNPVTFGVRVQRWATPGPHQLGDRFDIIQMNAGLGGATLHNIACNGVTLQDTCNSYIFDGNHSSANAAAAVMSMQAGGPVAVPLASAQALLGLASAIGIFGALASRRRAA